MAVGPQYQSQLALLAGALGHGLDPTQGYSIYQNTLQQAQAAQAQRQQTIQQELGQLSQIATQAATSGQTPDQVQALVKASTAGLPYANAVQQGTHHILGQLSNYQATPDPMAQAQLQGQLISNQKGMLDLQTGAAGTALDPTSETVFGPAHAAQVQQLTQQYLNQGMSVSDIRGLIVNQILPQLAPPVDAMKGGIKVQAQAASYNGIVDAINQVVSSTVAQIGVPGNPDWAAQNLQGYGAPPPPPPPPKPVVQTNSAPSAVSRTGSSYWDTALGALDFFT